MEDRLCAVEAENSKLKQRVIDLEGRVAALEGENARQKQEVAELEDQLTDAEAAKKHLLKRSREEMRDLIKDEKALREHLMVLEGERERAKRFGTYSPKTPSSPNGPSGAQESKVAFTFESPCGVFTCYTSNTMSIDTLGVDNIDELIASYKPDGSPEKKSQPSAKRRIMNDK